MSQGYFAFVLHSHLSYVLSHGRWPHGTDWLTEAAAETYLPIIRIMNELISEGCHPKLTIGLSPVLCEQLADNTFKDEFVYYLNLKIKAAEFDSEEFSRFGDKTMLTTSHYWENFYRKTLEHFDSIGHDILYEFRKLQDDGYLEIITCGATHGYYPLLARDESLQVQTKMAVRNYRHHFGKDPKGIWLPECAYRPRYDWQRPDSSGTPSQPYLRKGADEFLTENGLDFFIIDSALLKGGKSVGVYIDRFDALKTLWNQFEKQYQPQPEDHARTPREVYLINSANEDKKPTAIFTRDPETGLLVCSGKHGYPGDSNYLDFHKKRHPGGHRYWAVTSVEADLADKKPYYHDKAMERIPENADHFSGKVTEILKAYAESGGEDGILVAPYDAELFGHWWFEGPQFLKRVLRNISESSEVETTFLHEHLARRKPTNVISIPEGSWGEGNNHYIWLNKHTEWTWKHIYQAEDTMCDLARRWASGAGNHDKELESILKQAARELMLLSSSDWQFLISTWSARDYGELRISEHNGDFVRLAEMAEKKIAGTPLDPGDIEFFKECSARDCLFDDIDLEWFAKVEYPAESSLQS